MANPVNLSIIKSMFDNREFISIIKEIRSFTGLGLKDARDIADKAIPYLSALNGNKDWSEKSWNNVKAIFSFPNETDSLMAALSV